MPDFSKAGIARQGQHLCRREVADERRPARSRRFLRPLKPQTNLGVREVQRQQDFDTTKGMALEYIDTGMCKPSATDLISIEALCPNWRKRAIQICLDILKDNWTAVRGVAFELHDNHRGEVFFAAFDLEGAKWRGFL